MIDIYYDEFKGKQLYLIKALRIQKIFIAYFETPNKNTQLNNLEKFNRSVIYNAIALDSYYIPQSFSYSDITDIWRIPVEKFESENRDFRTLLTALFNLNGSFQDYKCEILKMVKNDKNNIVSKTI